MIKTVFIIILKLYFINASTSDTNSKESDLSECFLANNYLNLIDILIGEQTEQGDQITLAFNFYNFYSSCYALEAYFQKENVNFSIEAPEIIQGKGEDHSQMSSLVKLNLPQYDLQSICLQNSRRTNQCNLVLQVYLKDQNTHVAQIQCQLEVNYNFRNPSTLVYVKLLNTNIEITNIRSQIFTQVLENQNNISKIKSSYLETFNIDQYYPIQMVLADSQSTIIENTTMYDAQSETYTHFNSDKYIQLNFTNYPTKFILICMKGSTLYLNIDSKIIQDPENYPNISLIESKLYFNIDQSFEVIQEVLLSDKYITIKMFLRVKYNQNEYLMIERLHDYEKEDDQISIDSIFNFKTIQKNQIMIIVGIVVLIFLYFTVIIMKRLFSKQDIIEIKKIQKNEYQQPEGSPDIQPVKNNDYIKQDDLEE